MPGKPVGSARHPFTIAAHPTLEPEVKRAILANWASDVHAVESCPTLRQPPGLDEPVSLDAVLGALKSVGREGLPGDILADRD
ncbi:hypothetical protein ACFB49_26880 [Sphingomonas sp. DBB INV C78]|uniref:hypothetical protein n=1 Tax=Sphingomonas sp. DBB INV C78 TaxID=3349434 RepID=UPI0036D410BB